MTCRCKSSLANDTSNGECVHCRLASDSLPLSHHPQTSVMGDSAAINWFCFRTQILCSDSRQYTKIGYCTKVHNLSGPFYSWILDVQLCKHISSIFVDFIWLHLPSSNVHMKFIFKNINDFISSKLANLKNKYLFFILWCHLWHFKNNNNCSFKCFSLHLFRMGIVCR